MQQTPAWIFFVIPAVVVAIGFLVALTRRGSVTGTRIGSRCHELASAGDPATMFERLRGIGAPYRIDDEDEGKKILVLSSPPTFATWGFLYPVVVTPATGGGSRIRIGITSRFIQFGPLVTRAHEHARKAIESTVGIPVARVA